MKRILKTNLRLLPCLLILFPITQAMAESEGPHVAFKLRAGRISFIGDRAFSRYAEELLNEKTVTGNTIWPRAQFFFNSESGMKPIYGMGIGVVTYQGQATRSYQGGEEFKVEVVGSYLEHGFTLGFHPGLPFLTLFMEAGIGLPLQDKITVTTPIKKRSFADETRIAVSQFSVGLNAMVLGFFAEAVVSGGIQSTDDQMFTLGGGYAF